MAELVVLQNKRAELTEGQERLVRELEKLLRRARTGQIRGFVYATVGGENSDIRLGMMNADNCGIHELIGLSELLGDQLRAAARDLAE